MADHGVAVTWGDAKTGREKQALDGWIDGVTVNDKAVADGRIEKWDAVLFEPNGGTPTGVIRVYGTESQIEEYIRSEDFTRVMDRGGLMLNNLAMRRFVTGDALAQRFAAFASIVDSL